ncbi:hypothetical protein [Kitasatospora sp. NPDC090091]|uniref:hypothetical protein n=1 Tax=Kitasatospora sp. NPDC090091 TaxID=3364081 RepID=UPI00380C72FB
MRVRATADTRTYFNYQIHELREGAEVDGELAAHLWTTRAPVEIVDGEPPAPAEPPADPEPGSDSGDGNPGDTGADGGGPDGEPPVDGTIEALMTWVGDDPDRAAAALAAEQAKDNPRATAVKRLAAVADTTED